MYKQAKFKGHTMQNQILFKVIKSRVKNKQGEFSLAQTLLQRLPRPLELLFILLIGFTMSTLISTAEAAEHIKVIKEILLEVGLPASPSVVIQTKDGGYVVAGNIATQFAWATRVDAKGNMQWRYEAPLSLQLPQRSKATFTSAVTLRNDTTLLCGWKEVREEDRVNIVGVLTNIDKTGKVLSNREIRPQETGDFALSYLLGCQPWGDGFALFGYSTLVSGDPQRRPRETENFQWILALDSAGEIKWEKLISTTEGLNPRAIYVAPDLDLVFQTYRISQNGEIRNTVSDNSSSHDLIPQITAGADGHWKIAESNNPLRRNSLISNVEPKVLFSLPNQSIVEFGSKRRNNAYYAAIGWTSPDRNHSEIYEYGDTLWVNDAMVTGTPGEFVTVRLVSDSAKKRLGMALSFIQIK